ncbi:hypothetical protein SDC9_94100 [bioreactor metagenome]|uniref:Phospholipid/glycerol acyltransferase domain-containing protein n=1 Tax=bioreactor metagenome TaxID=1076179 RepID=A0A645A2G4_9ZZZZ
MAMAALGRKLWRLGLFLLWMWPFALWSLLFAVGGRGGIRRVARCTRKWGRFLTRAIHIKVEFLCDHEVPEGVLIVSNHQGYIDVLVHAALFPIRFAPKAEIRRWPVLGCYLAISRPVWIDRSSRQKSRNVLEEFRRTLNDGVSLLVYPEGTSTDGRHGLLPFKSTPFETVIGTRYQIQPVITRYEIGADGWTPAWFGDQTLLPHVWALLGRKEIRARVAALPLVTVEPGEDRKQLAARIEAMMQAAENDRRLLFPAESKGCPAMAD